MGQMDIPLNETGIKQSNQIKRHIETLEIDRIWSSPLQRARQTAEIISDNGKYQINYNECLSERGWGADEGESHKHFLPDMKPLYRGKEGANDKLPEGAETYSAFEARIILGFQEILVPSAKPPLIVGHGGVFCVLTILLAEVTLPADNCAFYFFKPPIHADHSWSIINMGER